MVEIAVTSPRELSGTVPDIYFDDVPSEECTHKDADIKFMREVAPSLLERFNDDQISAVLQSWTSSTMPEELSMDAIISVNAHPEVKHVYQEAIVQLAMESQSSSTHEPSSATKGKAREQSPLGDTVERPGSSGTSLPISGLLRKVFRNASDSGASASASADSTFANHTGESIVSLESKSPDIKNRNFLQKKKEESQTSKSHWGLSKFTKTFQKRSKVVTDSLNSEAVPHTTTGSSSFESFDFGLEEPENIDNRQIRERPSSRVPKIRQGPIVNKDDITATSKLSGIHECASCMEEVPGKVAVKLQCTHTYCKECFGLMIASLSQNEIQWPPRCCLIDIPRQAIVRYLNPEQLRAFHVKEKEYSVPAAHRWYCTNLPACGKFFIPKIGGSEATRCNHCQFSMCIMCRGAAHEGNKRCSEDAKLQATLERAYRNGWRSCPSCSTLIERSAGCRHMTCLCGHQFCFVCLRSWWVGSCTCPDHGSSRLLNREQEMRQTVRTSRERQWQRSRLELDRQLLSQEIFDDEGREIEASLAEVVQQQDADMEERARIEEEEAAQMESERREGIKTFSHSLDVATVQLFDGLLRSIQARYETQVKETLNLSSQIQSLERAGKQRRQAAFETHSKELNNMYERHTSDMLAFKDRVMDMLISNLKKKGATCQNFGSMFNVYEAADTRFNALQEVQKVEYDFLKSCHKRALARIESTTQHHIMMLLTESDAVDDFLMEVKIPDTLKYLKRSDTVLDKLAVRAISDLKWFRVVKDLSTELRQERVTQLLSSGADAPEMFLEAVETAQT